MQILNKPEQFVRSANKPTMEERNFTFKKSHIFSFVPKDSWRCQGKDRFLSLEEIICFILLFIFLKKESDKQTVKQNKKTKERT